VRDGRRQADDYTVRLFAVSLMSSLYLNNTLPRDTVTLMQVTSRAHRSAAALPTPIPFDMSFPARTRAVGRSVDVRVISGKELDHIGFVSSRLDAHQTRVLHASLVGRPRRRRRCARVRKSAFPALSVRRPSVPPSPRLEPYIDAIGGPRAASAPV
jgi:hypothetical protein